MHLVPCAPPAVPLVVAPLTALARPSTGERWDGFWTSEFAPDRRETYFVRRTDPSGVQWFRMEDGEPAAPAVAGAPPRTGQRSRKASRLKSA